MYEGRREEDRERNEQTNTETPGDSEPRSIPNRLAADLQIQYSHLVYTRSTVGCSNKPRETEGDV